MQKITPHTQNPPRVLATDLDGTFIPLPEHPQNLEALKELTALMKEKKRPLVFSTGRHFESVAEAIQQHALPLPEWIICDVGTSIYHAHDDGHYRPLEAYEAHLSELTQSLPREKIVELFTYIAGLHAQASESQKTFKISYSCKTTLLEPLVAQINGRLKQQELPYLCMGSVDPFLDCGLIDVLPTGVNKSYAIQWLSTHANFNPQEVVYAGDSGNDLAALSAGFRAIIVKNASEGLKTQVRKNLGPHAQTHLYCSTGYATSGVLEGCRHYGLV